MRPSTRGALHVFRTLPAPCLAAALLVAASARAGDPVEPPAGSPWPAGAVRARVQVPLFVHRPDGRSDATVRRLARKAAARHLPGFAIVGEADAAKRRDEAIVVILDGPMDPIEADYLRPFGRGIEPSRAAWLGKPHRATLLLVRSPRAKADAALRGAVAAAAEVALAIDGAVGDPEARLVYAPRAFDESVRREGFEGGLPVASRHFEIHTYETDGGLLRSVSVGMSKLGLPDVVVNGHSRSAGNQVVELMNVLGQWMVEGGNVSRAGWIDLDFHAIRARSVRQPLLASLKKGAKARASLSAAVGAREKGDAENALLELTFQGKPGSPGERQAAIVAEIFGSEDSVVKVRHDDALEAASRAARGRLVALKPRWLRDRALGEILLVKGPFETRSGGTEWMWVEVTRWEGKRITGVLTNDPFEVDGLRAGATVQVDETRVFDYLLRKPDGTQEGNTTAKLLEPR
jgi:hypothetical protein